MNAELYTKILEQYLVPFIQTVYPRGHRFMQDNDPKQTSRRSRLFFEEKQINWWPTPPESPNANPIENLWHELKVQWHIYINSAYCFQSFVGVYQARDKTKD